MFNLIFQAGLNLPWGVYSLNIFETIQAYQAELRSPNMGKGPVEVNKKR